MIFLIYTGTSSLIIYFYHPGNKEIQCSYVLDNGNPVLAIALLSGSILIIILIALASCKASFLDTLPVCQRQLLLRNRMQQCKVDNNRQIMIQEHSEAP